MFLAGLGEYLPTEKNIFFTDALFNESASTTISYSAKNLSVFSNPNTINDRKPRILPHRKSDDWHTCRSARHPPHLSSGRHFPDGKPSLNVHYTRVIYALGFFRILARPENAKAGPDPPSHGRFEFLENSASDNRSVTAHRFRGRGVRVV